MKWKDDVRVEQAVRPRVMQKHSLSSLVICRKENRRFENEPFVVLRVPLLIILSRAVITQPRPMLIFARKYRCTQFLSQLSQLLQSHSSVILKYADLKMPRITSTVFFCNCITTKVLLLNLCVMCLWRYEEKFMEWSHILQTKIHLKSKNDVMIYSKQKNIHFWRWNHECPYFMLKFMHQRMMLTPKRRKNTRINRKVPCSWNARSIKERIKFAAAAYFEN